MVKEQDSIEEEYQHRVDDLVTTLDELRMLDVPRLDIEQVCEGETWRDSTCPAAKVWRDVFDIVETHIGGAPGFRALDSRMPTQVAGRNYVVGLSAPQWLDDFVNIHVKYDPEGELGVTSSVILHDEPSRLVCGRVYDGRLHDLSASHLDQLHEIVRERGPFVENW